MTGKEPAYFNLETIALLREVLEMHGPPFGRSSKQGSSRPRWQSVFSRLQREVSVIANACSMLP
jgi:hypothetical protein